MPPPASLEDNCCFCCSKLFDGTAEVDKLERDALLAADTLDEDEVIAVEDGTEEALVADVVTVVVDEGIPPATTALIEASN